MRLKQSLAQSVLTRKAFRPVWLHTMAFNKLAWAALIIADANAFLPAPASLARVALERTSCGHDTLVQQPTSGRDLVSSGRRVVLRKARCCIALHAKKKRKTEQELKEEEEEEREMEEYRVAKLAGWKSMIKSGKLAEEVKLALDMDAMEQEEALEGAGSGRRASRKSRNKAEQQHDLDDLDPTFSKPSDWRDAASVSSLPSREVAAPSDRRRRDPDEAAAEPDLDLDLDGDVEGGNDLAARLVAGLGLSVVPAPGKGTRVSLVEEASGDEEWEGEEEEEEEFGGARFGGGMERDDGVRELKKAIRKEERAGKSAEKVVAMVVSAAERDGVRDDDLFSFAIKTLARMGRLDLSLRVNELRKRYLESEELEDHDRMTTAGLAVACLRNGDEDTALEVFHAAITPSTQMPPGEEEEEGQEDGEEEDEEEEEEEDWEKMEAEDEMLEILEVEGQVLPELLGYYLERVEKERSQEAAMGIRTTIDRALRQGNFATTASPPSTFLLSANVYNNMIRRLGKVDRLSDVFEVLDGMAALGVEYTHETLEFLINAAVKEVEFETRAVSMKTLPSGKHALPEVVFVGRSNVGKSSLVNMLVNRKALAPTSAVPGFTQHFNYYAVNKGRRKSPSFFLVDVPGLGYARADDGRMDSWKSTLQRYLRVRENLRVVFHLIDGRTGIQKADKQLMSLMNDENEGRSSFVVVITKCDKVGEEKRASVTEGVREALDESGFPASTPIIATSAKARLGRVELWSYLRLMFDVDRRKSKGVRAAAAAVASGGGGGAEEAVAVD